MEVRPGYKQTEVGVIPKNWEVKRLSDVADLRVGYAFKSTWFTMHDGVPLLRGENVGYGRPDWSDTRKLPWNLAKAFVEYILRPGDIVIGMDRTFTKSGTKISLIQDRDGLCLLVQRVGKFIPQKCNAQFLWALLSSSTYLQALEVEQKGMDIPHLSRLEILSPLVVIPSSLGEQQAIAMALSDADALIDALEQLIAKKRQVKQGAMQELLRPKNGWVMKRLGSTAILKARIGWQGLTTAEYLSLGDYYLVTGTDFLEGYIDWSHCHYVDEVRYKQDKNIQLHQGDVLLTKDGTIGKVAYVNYIDKPATLNSGVFVIRPIENSFNPEFFYYLLSSNVFTDFLAQLSAGSTINHLYQKDFVNFIYNTPATIDEQKTIANILTDMDYEIVTLKEKLAKARQVKQGMMQELLTGRIRLV